MKYTIKRIVRTDISTSEGQEIRYMVKLVSEETEDKITIVTEKKPEYAPGDQIEITSVLKQKTLE